MRINSTISAVVAGTLLGLGACSRTPEPSTARTPAATAAPADRKYLLERVDDAAIAQLYADGFSALSLAEKTLAWHLYQAALAGRDIYIDQRHRDSLEMRGILEQIVAHPSRVDPAAYAEICLLY